MWRPTCQTGRALLDTLILAVFDLLAWVLNREPAMLAR